MSGWRRILSGSFMAVLSSVLLLGSILLSYAENGYALASPVTITQTITAVPNIALASGKPYSESITPGFRPTDTPTFTPNAECIPPEGFKPYLVQPGDTLTSLAQKYSTSEKTLKKASCIENAGLSSFSLSAGLVLNVPDVHPTSVLPYCAGAPYGWQPYYVKTGDNLFTLSLKTRVTVADLQTANCLTSVYIYPGELIRLPFTPYSPPVFTSAYPPTVTPSATASPAPSWTPLTLPSWTPVTPATSTGTTPETLPSSTANPGLPASDTPVIKPPSSTPVALPTETPVPPPTDTPIPPPTDTPVPPPTNTPVPPPSDTPVPPPTDTPMSVPREITPDQPEPTVGVGFLLFSPFWILVKI